LFHNRQQRHRALAAERDARSRLLCDEAPMHPSFNMPIAVPLSLIVATLIAVYAVSFSVYFNVQ
jgi:hypothetical protein